MSETPTRAVTHRYEDPLDRLWTATAERIGFRVARSPEVYASTDGRRTITIGSPETLDPDDCLAQMILHELCHALIEGPAAVERPDWGLDNATARDVEREHACLRLQAALARPHGLGRFLAPTTEHRAFYDTLGADALAPRDAPSVVAARLGAHRAVRTPWAPHLESALAATAKIAQATGAPDVDGWASSLWSVVDPPPARHPLGFSKLAALDRRCGDCVWSFERGGHQRCRVAGGRRLDPSWGACDCFEEKLDCRTCAACCREAYGSVTIGKRDPVRRAHPELVVVRAGYAEIARDGVRCAALRGGTSPEVPTYTCSIYEARPKPCRDFELGGAHCLEARQRVGLS